MMGSYYDDEPPDDDAYVWAADGNVIPMPGAGEPRGATWKPVDLGPYLRGEIVMEEPSLGLARADGLRLIYPGKEHTVIGEMECGKSWFCAASAAAEIYRGNRVIYIHFEEAVPTDVIGRLQALGIRDDLILEHLAFIGPNEPVDKFVLAALLQVPPTLVILDGVNEAMSLHNQAIRDEDGAASFRKVLVKPFTRVGAAVLGCDHVVKDREKRGRSPLGSIHKGNGLDGVLIALENKEPFGRGEKGRSSVYITKDRPGFLRQNGRAVKTEPGKTFMGSLIVDDTRTYVDYLDLVFLEPQDQAKDTEPVKTQDQQDDERVLSVVLDLTSRGQQATGRAVRTQTGISKDRTADALTRLVIAGKLGSASGPRNATLFTVLELPLSGPGGPDLKDRGPLDHSNDWTGTGPGPLGTGEHTSTDISGQLPLEET